MTSDTNASLFIRNLDVLRRTGNAHLADRVASLSAPEGDASMLAIYQPDADTYLARQLAEFHRAPTRYALHVSGAPAHSPQISHKAMRSIMSTLQGKFLESVPDGDGKVTTIAMPTSMAKA